MMLTSTHGFISCLWCDYSSKCLIALRRHIESQHPVELASIQEETGLFSKYMEVS